ncbi:hypothetical protein IQ66_04300 [Leptospira borgpetersenii serovar Ballum]|nr:hypothetical protein IQ66_04300 [Leptospira borgpetersenii serovar Ballum]
MFIKIVICGIYHILRIDLQSSDSSYFFNLLNFLSTILNISCIKNKNIFHRSKKAFFGSLFGARSGNLFGDFLW